MLIQLMPKLPDSSSLVTHRQNLKYIGSKPACLTAAPKARDNSRAFFEWLQKKTVSCCEGRGGLLDRHADQPIPHCNADSDSKPARCERWQETHLLGHRILWWACLSIGLDIWRLPGPCRTPCCHCKLVCTWLFRLALSGCLYDFPIHLRVSPRYECRLTRFCRTTIGIFTA